jgi:AraC-like DNA-binding protein
MKLTFIEPRRELKAFVEFVWLFESPIGMPLSDTSLSAPDGRPKLIIPIENSITTITHGQIQQGYDRDLYFVGNRDSVTLLQTTQRKTCFVGIDFYPHGVHAILGLPMAEITNLRMPADLLLPKWGREIGETVRDKVSVFEKIDCVQSHLIASLRQRDLQSSIVGFCVEVLKKTDGLMSVRELERQSGYTHRYLEMLFKTHVGLSPKVLARIFRFQRLYRRWAEKRAFYDLKEEIYDYYYDQAHFTKEFKRMTSFSPEHFTSKVVNEFGRRLALH